jgi:hypothetical protein
MKIRRDEHKHTCGECCKVDYLWIITLNGPDLGPWLCSDCLLTLHSISAPLSMLVQTGQDISKHLPDSES